MASPKDKFLFDFSGGIRNDKSDLAKEDNEVVTVINFDLDRNFGRASKRKGFNQWGDDGTADVVNSFYWQQQPLGSTPTPNQLVAFNSEGTSVSKIVGTRLDGAILTTDVAITVISTAQFDASGDIEINGDIITYTAKPTGTTFTGVTGITKNHEDGSPIHQLDPLTGDALPDGRVGIYFASLNNQLVIHGRSNASGTWDGSTFTQYTDIDSAAGIFATTYRQRVYVAGDGSTDGANARNGSTRRVAFTEPGDATDWGDNTVNFFDVEDDRSEMITGLHSSITDELLIWKTNSVFAYNETTLKQRNRNVGAYNHYVIQEVNSLIYTFCPAGIYETNGSSFRRISDPVQEWIRDYSPTIDSTFARVVTNTFAASYKDKYVLWIGDVTTEARRFEESRTSFTGVALVFDTVTRSWSVYAGLNNFTHLAGFTAHKFENAAQRTEVLAGGDTSNRYYRFFSRQYKDANDNLRFAGADGDIFQDFSVDNATPVEAILETKFYPLGHPGILKVYEQLRAMSEGTGFQISFKLETERGEKDWESLGTTRFTNETLRHKENARGNRIKFMAAHADSNSAPILNGFVIENWRVASVTRKKPKTK